MERYRHVPSLLITSSFPLQGFVLSISTSSLAFFSYLPPSPCPIFNTNPSLSSQQGRGEKSRGTTFYLGKKKGYVICFNNISKGTDLPILSGEDRTGKRSFNFNCSVFQHPDKNEGQRTGIWVLIPTFAYICQYLLFSAPPRSKGGANPVPG